VDNRSRRSRVTPLALLRALFGLAGDRRGNIAAMTALLIVPLVGAMGLAVEVSDWYLTQRAIQNAADSGAIAAALNNGQKCADGTTMATGATTLTCSSPIKTHCSASSETFDCAAVATAAKYNLTDNLNTVTVTASFLTSGCPKSAPTCYEIAIQKSLPVRLMGLVGFKATSQIIKASAVSEPNGTARTYCILSLVTGDGSAGSANAGITEKGGGNGTDSTGCNLASDGGASCNNANHQIGDIVDSFAGPWANCAPNGPPNKNSQLTSTISDDAYRALDTNVSKFAGTCPSFAGSGTYTVTLASQCVVTGNLQVPSPPKKGAPTVLQVATAAGGSVLVIKNGTLDLNGGTFQVISGGGLTIIFTGGGSSSPYPSGSGTFDSYGPDLASGNTFAGISIYDDPLTYNTAFNMTYTGNSPTWNVTGLIYMPNADVTLKGDIGFASDAAANSQLCFSLVDQTFQSNGNWAIYPAKSGSGGIQSQCTNAGLTPPTSNLSGGVLSLIK
jgi:Flp pilus assembly protein TadG